MDQDKKGCLILKREMHNSISLALFCTPYLPHVFINKLSMCKLYLILPNIINHHQLAYDAVMISQAGLFISHFTKI